MAAPDFCVSSKWEQKLIMKIKIPKGLIVFASLLILTSMVGIKNLFGQNAGTILFGRAINGSSYYLYYGTMLFANLIIAVSLLVYKRWAFVGYFLLSAFFICNTVFNMIFVKYETLIELSWKISKNSLTGYRIVMTVTLLLTIAFALWLYRYRSLFFGTIKKTC
jgi:hypothetical protein